MGSSPTSALFSFSVQTKKVERKAVSSSDSEEEKEDKITVAYKSTRSAVSWRFLLSLLEKRSDGL